MEPGVAFVSNENPISQTTCIVYPTGAAQPRKLDQGGLITYETGALFPDGKKVLFMEGWFLDRRRHLMDG
jgi:hypothetical protein